MKPTSVGGRDVRLNLGCGGRPLAGYINVDSDNLEALRSRYPGADFPDDLQIFDYDIFNLPFPDGAVAEVRADSLIEHLSFIEEPRFFLEVKRVLRPGGLFQFSTTDFDAIAKLWLEAKDEWKDFFRNDAEAISQNHWFGQNSYSTENKWGYLCAMIYGSQNGQGQFHQNCYTRAKLRAILKHLGFEITEMSDYRWKGDRDPMIQVKATKSRQEGKGT